VIQIVEGEQKAMRREVSKGGRRKQGRKEASKENLIICSPTYLIMGGLQARSQSPTLSEAKLHLWSM